MDRDRISDEHWAVIARFLPSGRGRNCRPAHDNRLVFAGTLWILRSGAARRELPDTFGKWNSIYRRFRRWCDAGVFDDLLETLLGLGMTEEWRVQIVDSTVVRGHSQAAGANKGGPDPGFGRSHGGFTSKIHLRADGLGRPIGFLITGGQASDSRHLQPLMALAAAIRRPDFLLGDKGYDSDDNRGSLLIQGIRPVIPSMRTRKIETPHNKALYRQRNRIERMIGKLAQSRRMATRYDKTTASFRGFITLAAIRLWLPSFVHTTQSSSFDDG